MHVLIISHAVSEDGYPCPDGFAASYVVARALDLKGYTYSIEYVITGSSQIKSAWQDYDRIILVDVWLESSLLLQMSAIKTVTIVDHHAGNLEAFNRLGNSALKAYFDLSECAATLAWKMFFPDRPLPLFLKYVRDRDLWDLLLPDTQEVHCGLNILNRTFEAFDLYCTMSDAAFLALVANAGKDAAEKRRQKVTFLAERHQLIEHCDRIVPALILPPSYNYLASDIGSLLTKQHPDAPFAALHRQSMSKWSYRSNKHGNNFDLLPLLQSLGGSGHNNAGGWTYKISQIGEKYEFFLTNTNLWIVSGIMEKSTRTKQKKTEHE